MRTTPSIRRTLDLGFPSEPVREDDDIISMSKARTRLGKVINMYIV